MRQARPSPGEHVRAQLIQELWGVDGAVPAGGGGRLLRTSEVAALFQVSPRAVTAWATSGRLPSVRTPGGHHRYPSETVRAMLSDQLVPDGQR